MVVFKNKMCEVNNCSKAIILFNDFNKIKEDNQNWKNLLYTYDDVHLKLFGNSLVAEKIINEIN